jgi:hypothetical protein
MPSDFAQLSCLPSVDAEYRFGRPKVYLTPHELARLTLVRSRLGDTRAEREAECPSASPRLRHEATRPDLNLNLNLNLDSGQVLA